MISLTPTVLKRIMPNCRKPELWVRPLNDAMRKFDISTPNRQAAFLAQVAHESAELNSLEENLSYAPGRLTAVWPKRFPDADKARPYSRNPEKLANAVYASRLGNGDEASRDGYRFRGRGLVQVTGRDNYKRIGEVLKIDLINMPDTLFEPKYAALSAAAFWDLNNLNRYADDGDFAEVTYRVSGSRATVDQRKVFYGKALEAFNGSHGSDGAQGDSGLADHPGVRSKAPGAEAKQAWFD